MAEKMKGKLFEYKNAEISRLYPASTIAAQYVRQKFPEIKKVRYIGMEPMGEELRSNGLETIGGTNGEPTSEEGGNCFKYETIKDYKFDEDVGAVVCGIDFNISYTKIALASMYI